MTCTFGQYSACQQPPSRESNKQRVRPCTGSGYQALATRTIIRTLSSIPLVAKPCLVVGSQPPHCYRLIDTQLANPMCRIAQKIMRALTCTANSSSEHASATQSW